MLSHKDTATKSVIPNFDGTDFTCHFPAHNASAKSREIRSCDQACTCHVYVMRGCVCTCMREGWRSSIGLGEGLSCLGLLLLSLAYFNSYFNQRR